MKTIVLAHYYVSKEVQAMADYVGDSLDLSKKAANSKADRIVFAGVRFMAETAKLLSPNSEVILPDWNSTCSLVEQTDTTELRKWRNSYPNHTHVMYINSSLEQKALADWIVTSRNVEPIIKELLPDRKGARNGDSNGENPGGAAGHPEDHRRDREGRDGADPLGAHRRVHQAAPGNAGPSFQARVGRYHRSRQGRSGHGGRGQDAR